MGELQWGFYHLSEDEKHEGEKYKLLLETLTALLNPEAYKKYKNNEHKDSSYTSDNFLQQVMQASGMTADEARKFMDTKNSEDKDTVSGLDTVIEPFIV